jgi:DnaK suppressor protein
MTTGLATPPELDGSTLAPDELAALRAALHAERRFRIEQLAAAPPAAVKPDGTALAEVHAAVLEGARRALADIDDALTSMAQGHYPRCRGCAGSIPLAVLRAIPRTRLCPACHATGAGPGPR